MNSNTKNIEVIAQAFSWLRAMSGNALTKEQVIAGDKIIENLGFPVFAELINFKHEPERTGVTGQYDISDMGYNMIKDFEGLELKAYQDSGGIWTIGHGTIRYPNGTKVQKGDTCTAGQALEWLKNDCLWVDACLDRYVTTKISQNQFDALASFIYNVGETAFKNSSMLRLINANELRSAANQFDVWVHVKGKRVQGLVNRRNAEKRHFLGV
ncbi:lysozyme (plasmid) [Acinetobacter defluvii]|uniref:Lysozyme n=1 Tax=Acinetobacter defluvii TaxID=1871111 RepID=A0A2S2F8L4_9GAMM|nr:lysozyme [Acinetobacter defluvii]AWL27165.1 lysozyme [Acinetobacter defluvii]